MRRTMRSQPMERDHDDGADAQSTKAGERHVGLPSDTPDEPRQAVPTESQQAVPADAQLPAALVDELFSILSHELRAPLTTIKGSSRTLLRHGAALDPAAARQLLQDIDQEADRMHRLVDNLLELARAGTGKNALHPEPTAVDTLLRRVVADATPRARTGRPRVRAPHQLPQPSIHPVPIEQVGPKLGDNTVKISPPTRL